MPEPDWNRLRSFALVVRHGSIARAAANSLSTQPTLSRHIRELEEELGLQLFTRSRNGLALTSLGTEIYEKTRLMTEAALSVMNLADGQSEEIGGSVRVAASVNIARHLLPAVLAPIRDQYDFARPSTFSAMKLSASCGLTGAIRGIITSRK